MAASKKLRLTPDPCVGIRDLMQVLLPHITNSAIDFDLHSVVSPPDKVAWSWKTAPNCAWISKMKTLLCGFLRVAPNGVLASTQLKSAVSKLCTEQEYKKYKVNKSKLYDCDFADQCDEKIRIVLAQLRLLKKYPQEYSRAMRKATPSQKENIDVCLGLLQLDTEVPDSELQMVLYEPPAASSREPSSGSNGASTIFQRILQKRISSPSKAEVAAKVSVASQSTALRKQKAFCVAAGESTASEASPPTKKNAIASGLWKKSATLQLRKRLPHL